MEFHIFKISNEQGIKWSRQRVTHHFKIFYVYNLEKGAVNGFCTAPVNVIKF